jgi:hypothetical protein
VRPAGKDELLHLAGIYVKTALGVQLSSKQNATLSVAGVVIFVLSHRVVKEREREHDSLVLRLLSLPWESAQEFLTRCIAAYPTVHPLVARFRAVGVSRPVDLTDLGDRAFALGVIEGWAAQVGADELPPGIGELADALRAA